MAPRQLPPPRPGAAGRRSGGRGEGIVLRGATSQPCWATERDLPTGTPGDRAGGKGQGQGPHTCEAVGAEPHVRDGGCLCVCRTPHPPSPTRADTGAPGRAQTPTYSKYSAAGVVRKLWLRPGRPLALPAGSSTQRALFQVLLQWVQGRATAKDEKR